MGNQLLASKIVVEEEKPQLRQVPTLPTAICGVVGLAQKGPIGVATLVQSYEDFARIFGGPISASFMSPAVQAYFDNGGSQLWVVRTVHYTSVDTASSKISAAATRTLLSAATGTPITMTVTGKYDGTYANVLTIKISAATSGEALRFNFQTLDSSGLILETFPNLTMDNNDARYALTILNNADSGSQYWTVADSEVTLLDSRPVNGSFTATGGNDGLVGLVDNDYIGSSAGSTGIRALDIVDDLTLLMIPGIATSAVHNAMIAYGDVTRSKQVFSVLDPPSGNSATQIITYVETTAALLDLSEMAAIYWPRVLVLNPNKTIYGNTDQLTVPPSGHICGVISRTDNARVGGVYDCPAGIDRGVLYGVLGFETKDVLKEDVRDLVFPKAINPLRTEKGKPRYIDGGRTLKRNGNWPQVHQRRGASHIERSLKGGLDFVRHSNNDADGELRATAKRTTFAFLKSQMDVGAFASRTPDKAFYIDFGNALNPASKANIVTGRIGLAMVTAAEFVVLRFSQDTRAIDAEIAAASN